MRMCDLAWSLWAICCLFSFWPCVGPMLMRGNFLWKILDYVYVTCLYVPMYLVSDACAHIVAIMLIHVSGLASCSALCIFKKHMLGFVDLIHALPTRGRKVPNSCFHGEFCIKGIKIGRNAFVQGELAFMHFGALFRLNFSCALLLMVSSPFYLTLRSRQFWSILSQLCPCLWGLRCFSLKWSCLGFCLAFDHLFEFFCRFFLFSFLLIGYLCVLSMHSARGRLRACMVQGPVDGHFLLWWLIYNIVWTNSWLSGAGCSLIGASAGEEQAQKVDAGVEQTSRHGLRDLVTSGMKCETHGGKDNKTKSWTIPWLSLKTKVEPGRRGRLHQVRGGCIGSPQNH
jgi:hypothetical protein